MGQVLSRPPFFLIFLSFFFCFISLLQLYLSFNHSIFYYSCLFLFLQFLMLFRTLFPCHLLSLFLFFLLGFLLHLSPPSFLVLKITGQDWVGRSPAGLGVEPPVQCFRIQKLRRIGLRKHSWG